MRRAALLVLLPLLWTAAEPLRPRRRVVLFDGKDLKSFYISLRDSGREDPKHVFSLVNAQIRISGEEFGALTTKQEFRDYRLLMDWRWGGKTYAPRVDRARDSGILLHGTGADGAAGNGWLESIEYQMIEGGTGDIILVKGARKPRLTVEAVTGPDKQLYWKEGAPRIERDSGRINWYGRDLNWKDQIGWRGPMDVEAPLGDWNRTEIVADGGHLVYYLNGRKVNEGFDSDHTSGRIQFQSEGAEVYIRRIELRPLEKR